MTLDACFHISRGSFELTVDFSVPAQGVTAFFGPSGSGKTLTLRSIAGLERVPGGIVKLGTEVWQDGHTFVPPHLRGLGYVFQEPSLFTHLNVLGNLEYARRRVPIGRHAMDIPDAASLLSITTLLNRTPHSLSGGERQRVAIARALLSSPQLLLMDEPLASLDQTGKNEILPFLDRLHQELDIPIVYVTHAVDEVAQLADRMVMFEKESVQQSGPINEMLTRLDLPLALGPEAESVIDAVVTVHDSGNDLTIIEFVAGRFFIPGTALPIGKKVRIRLRARDVSLTLEQHSDTSILNIFRATVDAISENEGPQVTVRLNVDSVPILARITRHSAARLGIESGAAVYIQVKSVAVLS